MHVMHSKQFWPSSTLLDRLAHGFKSFYPLSEVWLRFGPEPTTVFQYGGLSQMLSCSHLSCLYFFHNVYIVTVISFHDTFADHFSFDLKVQKVTPGMRNIVCENASFVDRNSSKFIIPCECCALDCSNPSKHVTLAMVCIRNGSRTTLLCGFQGMAVVWCDSCCVVLLAISGGRK